MKARCYNKKNKYYCNYGGRGILICNQWMGSVEEFYNWAIQNGYQEGLSIERIDNNGNYCPENCKWATKYEQERNTRKNRFFTAFGETKCFTDWRRDERCVVGYGTLHNRINIMGMSMEESLTTPPKTNNQFSKIKEKQKE